MNVKLKVQVCLYSSIVFMPSNSQHKISLKFLPIMISHIKSFKRHNQSNVCSVVSLKSKICKLCFILWKLLWYLNY